MGNTTYRYHYKGEESVHLPLHGITAEGGSPLKVYETDEPIEHPDFVPVTGKGKERPTDINE